MSDFGAVVKTARKRLLRMHYESGVGHIGGNLSCFDALMTLHHEVLGPHDQFILSKGHAIGALYVTLWSKGVLSDDDLKKFHKDDSKLAGHPAPGWIPQIPFATGSLGHGMSLAAGLALGKRFKGEGGRVFCLTSDGEWQEGSTWEALIFFSHHKLNNLTVLVDVNGLQGFGSTNEVASMHSLADKLTPFGVEVQEINGHSPDELKASLRVQSTRPRVILMKTKKGYPISYMEDRMEWHYLPMSEEQFTLALAEVDRK